MFRSHCITLETQDQLFSWLHRFQQTPNCSFNPHLGLFTRFYLSVPCRESWEIQHKPSLNEMNMNESKCFTHFTQKLSKRRWKHPSIYRHLSSGSQATLPVSALWEESHRKARQTWGEEKTRTQHAMLNMLRSLFGHWKPQLTSAIELWWGPGHIKRTIWSSEGRAGIDTLWNWWYLQPLALATLLKWAAGVWKGLVMTASLAQGRFSDDVREPGRPTQKDWFKHLLYRWGDFAF